MKQKSKKISKEVIIEFLKKYRSCLMVVLATIVTLVIGFSISGNFSKEKISLNSKSSGMVANTNKDVIKEEVYENLKFTNISLITEDGYSTFTADVTNTGNEDSNISDVNIVLKDKNGNSVITLRGNIGDTLKAGEARTITASTKGELNGVVAKAIAKYE